MLCKVTGKNQLTLSKENLQQFIVREYFDAKVGRLVTGDGHILNVRQQVD